MQGEQCTHLKHQTGRYVYTLYSCGLLLPIIANYIILGNKQEDSKLVIVFKIFL